MSPIRLMPPLRKPTAECSCPIAGLDRPPMHVVFMEGLVDGKPTTLQLSEKTYARIVAGIKKYGRRPWYVRLYRWLCSAPVRLWRCLRGY